MQYEFASQAIEQLKEISQVMSDPYHFAHMVALVNQLRIEANDCEVSPQALVGVVDAFHKFCVVVKNK